MKNNIKHKLWQTLHDKNLVPDYNSYITIISHINEQGNEMWCEMQKNKTGATLKKMVRLSELKLTEADLIRVLGFGVVVTQYLIEPISMPKKSFERVVYSGAIANLLVTLFDHYIDNQFIKNFKLIESTLSKKNNFIDKIKYGVYYLQGNLYQRQISNLINIYYNQIDALSDRKDSDIKQKTRALNYIIDKMYVAEKLSLLQPKKYTSVLWRHKSALPFLAMGIPAWFPTPINKELWIWHLRWMYSFGDLMGLIDDAVDFENDTKSASPNIYNMLMPDGHDNRDSVNYFCNKISNRIIFIQTQFINYTNTDSLILNQLPLIMICSWFGGVGWKPKDEIKS